MSVYTVIVSYILHILYYTFLYALTLKLFELENSEDMGVGNNVDSRVWKGSRVQA